MPTVRVFLSGTSFAAVTASDGSYSIDAVPPGKYTASILSPRLDSLLLDPPARELTLSAGEAKDIDFAVPSLATFFDRLCTAGTATDTLGAVFGVVRDTAGALARGVAVQAEWKEILGAGANALRVRTITRESTTAGNGHYALCALPLDTQITIGAREGHAAMIGQKMRFVSPEARRLDFRLRAP